MLERNALQASLDQREREKMREWFWGIDPSQAFVEEAFGTGAGAGAGEAAVPAPPAPDDEGRP
jgi:hypothetical protein